MNRSDIYLAKTYLMQALSPVHVGTGGYQMGRVDNTIVRDYESVPKIPGTSLSGTCRAYLALSLDNGKYKSCAGNNTCGDNGCPICVIFGFSEGEKKGQSLKGMVNFYDAYLLLFPIATTEGVVWITTPRRLARYLTSMEDNRSLNEFKNFKLGDDEFLHIKSDSPSVNLGEKISLGWLLLEGKKDYSEVNLNDETLSTLNLKLDKLDHSITDNIVFVNDSIFNNVVNDNLEVRTSVAIDPITGAAVEGALFTYEAIPTMSVFHFDLVLNNYKYYNINEEKLISTLKGLEISCDESSGAFTVLETLLNRGFDLYPYLGIGGMTTRGFGRVKVINPLQGGE